MKPRSLDPELIGLYVEDLEYVVEDGEPLLLEAETEEGPVTFKYSVREWGEDEIAVKYPTEEPGEFKEVTVFRDIRSHLKHPVPTENARTVELQYGESGELRGSLTRLATISEIADALIKARDLFKADAFKPQPVGLGQR